MGYFVSGAIEPETISTLVSKHAHKTDIGGHHIFLGQVRADLKDGKMVRGIDYSAYEPMAEKLIGELKEETITRFKLSCAHVVHSLGYVPVGALCFLVFTSAPHREAAREACAHLTDQIKLRVPIFGKEMLDDQTHAWKVNR